MTIKQTHGEKNTQKKMTTTTTKSNSIEAYYGTQDSLRGR